MARLQVSRTDLAVTRQNEIELIVMKRSNKLRTAVALVVVILSSATALPLNMGKVRTSRIRFSRGRTTAIRKGKIAESDNDLYLVRAKAGQTMIVHITSKQGNAVFDIIEPPPGSGTPFVRESKDWTDKLERSGDYRISVYGLGGAVTNYTLEVTVR